MSNPGEIGGPRLAVQGTSIPCVGLGTFLSKEKEVENAVFEALKLGYRHIDCAQSYENEAEVGNGLKKAFEAGVCSREDVWLTSKLSNFKTHPKEIRAVVEQSLKDYQTDYLDLFLIHHPFSIKRGADGKIAPRREGFSIQDIWRTLEELKDEGKIKNLGVSNFRAQLLNDLLCYAKHKPICNQIERHPYLQQNELVEWMRAEDIACVCYGPLGAPGLNEETEARKILDPLLSNPVITEIANGHKVTPAQVLIRWAVQSATVVIPKTVKTQRLKENFSVFSFELTSQQMESIKGLDTCVKEGRFFRQNWVGAPELD